MCQEACEALRKQRENYICIPALKKLILRDQRWKRGIRGNSIHLKIIIECLPYIMRNVIYLTYATCISSCTWGTSEFTIIVITQVKPVSPWHSGEQQKIFSLSLFHPNQSLLPISSSKVTSHWPKGAAKSQDKPARISPCSSVLIPP